MPASRPAVCALFFLLGCQSDKPAPTIDSAALDSTISVDSEDCEESLWYMDGDGDGYGDVGSPVEACEAPDGAVADAQDCDDADPDIHPAAEERCNEQDDDCDTQIDEDVTTAIWYVDADLDGFGDPDSALTACAPEADWISVAGDCDDAAPTVNPAASEICENEIDEDCDGADDWCGPYGDISLEDEAVLGGRTDGATLGGALDAAGDVNGDGSADIIVGGYGDLTGGYNAGAAFVLFGPFERGADLADLDLSVIEGVERDYVGLAVVGAGDMDGDGYGEVLVSATGQDPARVGVFSGPLAGDISFSDGDAFVTDDDTSTYFGSTAKVAGGSDLSGDGTPDLAIGRPAGWLVGCGAGGGVVVAFGPHTGTRSFEETDATLQQENEGDCAGVSVSSRGDIDGDGRADLVIGATADRTTAENAGAVYVWTDEIAGTLSLADAAAKWVAEAERDYLGIRVSADGDLDGDGYADVAMSATGSARGAAGAGSVYIQYGGTISSGSVSSSDAIIDGNGDMDTLGQSISNDGGDVNGDGFADLLMGATRADGDSADAGAAYLFLGPVSGALKPSDADGRYLGLLTYAGVGSAVSTGGDLNADGYDEILIGAGNESYIRSNNGTMYVLFGG